MDIKEIIKRSGRYLPFLNVSGTITTGAIEVTEDSGAVSLANLPVSATPAAGTEESYSFDIDGNAVLTVYGEADSSGGTQNRRARLNAALNVDAAVSVTLASNVLTLPEDAPRIKLVVEGGTGAGADQLDTITGGIEGDIISLEVATTGANDSVVVATGVDNILCPPNFTMDNVADVIFLQNYDGSNWRELFRKSNA